MAITVELMNMFFLGNTILPCFPIKNSYTFFWRVFFAFRTTMESIMFHCFFRSKWHLLRGLRIQVAEKVDLTEKTCRLSRCRNVMINFYPSVDPMCWHFTGLGFYVPLCFTSPNSKADIISNRYLVTRDVQNHQFSFWTSIPTPSSYD